MGKAMGGASNRKIESTAYHEAGHAVVGWDLHTQLTGVTIVASGDALGICQFHKRGNFHLDRSNYMVEDSDWRTFRRVVNVATRFLAGMEAEREFTGRYNYRGASSDYEWASEICHYFSRDDYGPEADAMIKWLRLRAKNIVQVRWAGVEALARQLLEAKTLKGREAEEVIRMVYK